MDCSEAQNLLGSWIDGEIAANDSARLESHLADCAECNAVAEKLRTQHTELLRAFQPQREAAAQLSDRVVRELQQDGVSRMQTGSPARNQWVSLLLATAVGFLLAVVVFQPWKPAEPIVQRTVVPQPPPQPVEQPAAARLVLATGAVDVRQPGAQDWETVPEPISFACPSDTTVRTGADVRCELRTPDGSVIRLNGGTEVTLRAADTLEVRNGQVWCRAPEDVALKVLAADPSGSPHSPAAPWKADCNYNSCLLTNVQNGNVEVTTAAGEVDLETPSGKKRLKSGETAKIVAGRIAEPQPPSDPLLAARWMHPLLTKKGYADEELGERVNEFLAGIGQTKMSTLYEQEIRGLGEHCVLPLIRFVQSPLSQKSLQRRLTAITIVADLAPTWAIGDLIDLLSDDDAGVRFYAAAALRRLTAHTFGREPDSWRQPREECAETIDQWQAWWRANRNRYTAVDM